MLRILQPSSTTPRLTRAAHDITIRPRTKRVVVASGAGGRSSVSGHVATVFGSTGFVARYLVNRLAASGTQVVVPFRGDDDDKRHLKLMGDLGQIVPTRFDLRDTESIRECVRHSDVVYNLIGRDFETKNFSFDAVHRDGAKAIAEICAEQNVDRLVHVSTLNADPSSPSKFLRSKYAGEEAVKNAFPSAVIVRPANIYGAEDRFLIRIATGMRFHFLVNNLDQKVRPVCVSDVATALHALLTEPNVEGRTFDFYGPNEYTVQQVEKMVSDLTLRKTPRVHFPKPIAMAIAKLMSVLPWHTIATDEITRLHINDSPTAAHGTLQDLGIEPARLQDMALQYVRGFRDALYYEMAQEEATDFRNSGKGTGRVYHTTY